MFIRKGKLKKLILKHASVPLGPSCITVMSHDVLRDIPLSGTRI
jgi:hypothetical protein